MPCSGCSTLHKVNLKKTKKKEKNMLHITFHKAEILLELSRLDL